MAKKAANDIKQEQQLTDAQPTCLPKRCRSACILVSSLIAAIALGLSAYNWYAAKQYQTKVPTNLAAELSGLKQQVREVTDNLNQQQAELGKTQLHLIELAQIKNAHSWQIQEMSYLLRLADLNLKYQHDPTAALTLLLSIDEQLAHADNPQLDKFRQTLARDIASVRAMQSVDTAGVLAKLKILSEQVVNLPTITPTEQPQTVSVKPTAQSVTDHWWQNVWQQVQYALGHLVVIHRYDQATQPIVTKEQQSLFVAIIQMHLLQAQWAVLHYQQDLFAQNIQQAIQLAQVTFSASPQKAALITSLTDLQQLNLAVSAPELSNTLAAMPATTQQAPAAKLNATAKPAKVQQEAALV